jgi:putative methanogenesis marker 13 metalloprotein
LHPRPSPIAASLYTLRDMNADVIILHGPHGCCFRTGRLLENDGVRVVTTAMSENDFIFGASSKLEETLQKVDSMFSPELVGIVGTCASMIIGEDLKEAIQNANINAKVLAVESHGGLSEGDNTEGAIAVLEAASKEGIIPVEECERQSKMLKLATEIEKTRGMAQGSYIAPSYGDDKKEIAEIVIEKLKNGEKVAIIINAKKETSYLFADILKIPFDKINSQNKPIIIANLDENIGLPRIRQHAINIKEELQKSGLNIDIITGGLDEYPVTGEEAAKTLKDKNIDFVIVAGVPHAVPIETMNTETLAITDGPRLVEPLKKIGYNYVVTELDAHAKTLGTDKIVKSDFGEVLRELLG